MAEYLKRKLAAPVARWRKLNPWIRYGLIPLALSLVLALGVLAQDTDNDGLPDWWEMLYFGNLDQTPAGDPDGDNVSNTNEFSLGTDPTAPDTDRDGFPDGEDANPTSRVYMAWGDPRFIADTNFMNYPPQPGWFVSAYKDGGDWVTNSPTAWHVPASEGDNVGNLSIEVDRAILTNDVRLKVEFLDQTNASLYVDLRDANEATIATNLFGNILPCAAQSQSVTTNLIPFELYENAVGIDLRRGTGEITVYSCQLYVDKDGDGLDADQEKQLGTSDNNVDSDGDGLSDYAEVFIYHTSPTNSDTDGDGMSDGLEVYHGMSPTNWDFYSGLPFIENFETNTCQVGDLNGQNGWAALPANTVFVQTGAGNVYQGSQALVINQVSGISTAKHLFASSAGTVWADLYMKAVAATTPSGQVTDTAALYFSSNGFAVVYDGNSNAWREITAVGPFSTSDWVRVTVKLNYAAQDWQLILNGTNGAENLGFGASASCFSAISLEATKAWADNIGLSTSMPADLDLDHNGLADAWEIQYFGATGQDPSADPDNDGLSNLQEYNLGTNPNDPDTDHDGLSDSLEIYYGMSPTVSNNYSTVPFVENFETDTCQIGYLNGQNNWTASPSNTALVQTNIVYSGTQALKMNSGTNLSSAVRHLFATPASSTVWCDFHMKAIAANQPTGQVTDSAVFHFNQTGNLVVYDGNSNNWVTLWATVTTGDWARITLKLDYTLRQWDICLNGMLVADHLGFGTTATGFSAANVDAQSAYLDNFSVALAPPADVFTDEALFDWWPIYYFGTHDFDPSADPDGDGLTNLQEFQKGTNPFLADTDGDGIPDKTDSNPLVANHGNNPGGPTLSVESPNQGEVILW